MLTKILLITIVILLSWNSFQLSKNNEFLRSQVIELATNDQTIEDYLIVTKSLLDDHTKTLKKQSTLTLDNRQLITKLASNDKQMASLADLKKSLDKIGASTNTQIKALEKKIDASFKKQITLTGDNKKTIQEIKKTAYKVSDQIKKLRVDFVAHYKQLTSLHNGNHSPHVTYKAPANKKQNYTKPVVKKKNDTKPAVKVSPASNELSPFYKMALALYETKAFHNKKDLKNALKKLSQLKAEVWKSRKVNNIPTKLVMSILSSIDITKAKWVSKDQTYNLDSVEKKIIELFLKLGISK